MTKTWTLFGLRIRIEVSPAPFDYRGWRCTKLNDPGIYTWQAQSEYTTRRATCKTTLLSRVDMEIQRQQEPKLPPTNYYRVLESPAIRIARERNGRSE